MRRMLTNEHDRIVFGEREEAKRKKERQRQAAEAI